MPVEENNLGGDLPPRDDDELWASIKSFAVTALERKVQQLLQKVANKVRFNGEVLQGREEFSVAFMDHLEGLVRYSDFLNNDDLNKIIYIENGGKREELNLLLLQTVLWKTKLETTIRQVSEDSGLPLPAKLSHDDLDKWQVYMSKKLSNGGNIDQVTTEQIQNILQGEAAVDTLSYPVPPDISIEPLNTVQSLGGVSNEPSPLAIEVFPEPVRQLKGNVASRDILKPVAPKPLRIEHEDRADGDPTTTVKGSRGTRLKQRRRTGEEKRLETAMVHAAATAMQLQFNGGNGIRLKGRPRTCKPTSTTGQKIPFKIRGKFPFKIRGKFPFKIRGKFADPNVKHEEDTSCPFGVTCICGFEGTSRVYLSRHVKRLTDEWRYPCHICGWYFFSNSQREQHYKRKWCKPNKNNSNSIVSDGSSSPVLTSGTRDTPQTSKQGRAILQGNEESSRALNKESVQSKSGQTSRRSILLESTGKRPSGTFETADEPSGHDPDSGQPPLVNNRSNSAGSGLQDSAEATLTTSGSEAFTTELRSTPHESGDTVPIKNKITEDQSSAKQTVSAHHDPSTSVTHTTNNKTSAGESSTFAQPAASGNQCVKSSLQTKRRNGKRKRKGSLPRLHLGRCGFPPRSENEWKFKCSLCPSTFYGFEKLKEHLSKEHGRDNEFPGIVGGCSRCGDIFTNPKEWSTHHRGDRNLDVLPGSNVNKRITRWFQSSLEGTENIQVDFSNETDRVNIDTRQNERNDVDGEEPPIGPASEGLSPHHESDPTPNESETTRKALSTRGKRKQKGKKRKLPRRADDWKFICDVCATKFEHLSKLKDHLVRKHGVENPYPEYTRGCRLCGQMFQTNSDMVAHRKDCSAAGETQASQVQQGDSASGEALRVTNVKVETLPAPDNLQQEGCPQIDQSQPEESVWVKVENVEQTVTSKSAEIETVTISDDEA